MKKQGIIIKTIVAEEGMLLTQAADIAQENRTFSTKVYDNNLDNWVEWTKEDVETFIQERETNKEAQGSIIVA